MKKPGILFIVLFIIIMAVSFFIDDETAVSNQEDTNSSELSDSALLARALARVESSSTPSYSSEETMTLTRAAIIANDFVRMNFANDCDFETLDVRGGGTMVHNRFKVLQRFTSKRAGYERQYVYKIYVQYFGGDWTDVNNWEYGTLTVEDRGSGQQWVYKGNMKKREKEESVGGKIFAGGLEFTVAEKNPKAIRIYKDSKISIKQAKAVMKDLYPYYSTIQIATTAKHARGDEYMAISGDYFFEYKTGKMEHVNKFFK